MKELKTLHLNTTPEDLTTAATLLQNGELVAIPTETVYGLAADAKNASAVASIFDAKGRPQDNPLIVHIGERDQLDSLVEEIPEKAKLLADAYWPGPLTMIFKRSKEIPSIVSAGLDTVAVRFPVHPVAREIINQSGCPLAAPSANRSGSPSPTSADYVAEDMDGRIAAIVDGGHCDVGVESTVISMLSDTPRLLRPGGITVEMIESVIGPIEVDKAVTHQLEKGAVVASPGMKYKHYAPSAHVVLLDGSKKAIVNYINQNADNSTWALCFDNEESGLQVPFFTYGKREDSQTQAKEVFHALRHADEVGAKTLYVSCPSQDGIGLAVYNRLLRAAAFEVIHLEE